MSKFDSILENYLTEADSLDPNTLNVVADEIKNEGQPRNDGEKVLHVLATNPDINHIEDAYTKAGVSPESAQKDLIKMGINPVGNNQQKPETTPSISKSVTPNTSTPQTNTGGVQGTNTLQGV